MEHAEPTSKNAWMQEAAKKGLMLAVIQIVLFLIIYFVFTSKLTGFTYLGLIILVNLIFVIVNAIGYRRDLGGYITFGNVFKYVFVLMLVSGIVQTIFMLIFLVLEPSYPQVAAESQLNTSLYWAQKFGAPDATLDQIAEQFDMEEVSARFGIKGALTGIGIGIIFYAITAAIVGLIVKKSEPIQF